jgi:hypothetical protein
VFLAVDLWAFLGWRRAILADDADARDRRRRVAGAGRGEREREREPAERAALRVA